MEPDHAVQPEAESSSSPGAILRRCREFRGISLEEAAEATKIGKNYLRALEADRHQEFASPAYLKGFLKNYASYLGVDAGELLRLLEPAQPEPPSSAALIREQDSEHRRRFWQRLVLPAILLAAIIVVALLLRPADQPPLRPSAPAAPEPAAPAVQPQRSSSTAVQLQPAAAAAAPTGQPADQPPAPPLAGLTLRMKALAKVHLVVTMDDAHTHQYDLTAGDLIEWRADRNISLELSDPSGVELELNGRPYKPALPAGKTATLNLDVQGPQP